MAATEYNGIMTYLDADGNETALYPITKKQNIAGMEDIDAHVEATDNPHAVTPEQIGASPLDHGHDGVYMKAPEMQVGVEYKTNELYMGKPVYRKLVVYGHSGQLGSESTYIDYPIPHGISGMVKAIRCIATANNDGTWPYVGSTGGIVMVNTVDATYINLRVYKTYWNSPMIYFDLAYVKE